MTFRVKTAICLFGAVLPQMARAECFSCNYGLAIYLLASLGVAGLTGLIGVGCYLSLRRVPMPVVVVFLLAAVPPAIAAVLDWLNL